MLLIAAHISSLESSVVQKINSSYAVVDVATNMLQTE